MWPWLIYAIDTSPRALLMVRNIYWGNKRNNTAWDILLSFYSSSLLKISSWFIPYPESKLKSSQPCLQAPMWPHYLPLGHHLLPFSLAHSTEAPLISLLFLKHTRCGPTPGPLHWLRSLPGMLFPPVICVAHSLTSLSLYSNVTSSMRSSLTTYLLQQPFFPYCHS